MRTWNYSPEDVITTIGGFHTIEGIPDGVFINVIKDLPSFSSTRTTDGIVARTKVINSTYTIELSLMSTSPSNDTLTRLWQLDELTGMGKFPLLIKDTNGTGFFFSTETWIEGVPDLTYSTTIETFVWVLRSDRGMIHIGSSDETTAIEQLADLALSGLPFVTQVLQTANVPLPRIGSVDLIEG